MRIGEILGLTWDCKELLGDGYSDYGLVFARKDWRPYEDRHIAELLRRFIQEHELPPVVFHSLRHTFATTDLQNGVDVKTVSTMLDHYDAGFTLRTYTHATRQMQDKASETMGNFMEQVM